MARASTTPGTSSPLSHREALLRSERGEVASRVACVRRGTGAVSSGRFEAPLPHRHRYRGDDLDLTYRQRRAPRQCAGGPVYAVSAAADPVAVHGSTTTAPATWMRRPGVPKNPSRDRIRPGRRSGTPALRVRACKHGGRADDRAHITWRTQWRYTDGRRICRAPRVRPIPVLSTVLSVVPLPNQCCAMSTVRDDHSRRSPREHVRRQAEPGAVESDRQAPERHVSTI